MHPRRHTHAQTTSHAAAVTLLAQFRSQNPLDWGQKPDAHTLCPNIVMVYLYKTFFVFFSFHHENWFWNQHHTLIRAVRGLLGFFHRHVRGLHVSLHHRCICSTHIHAQDIKAAQCSACLSRLGALCAVLDRPLAHALQPPAGIASGNHGASVWMWEVGGRKTQHNTWFSLGSRPGHLGLSAVTCVIPFVCCYYTLTNKKTYFNGMPTASQDAA